ncbi:MAG: tRNA (adenosine(37)-N6)-threonylcarbamoyltransferase complex ATPase subunit type 1 TsaE [Bdellovibrio sp.]|nr:tRNA (adenosine(37)-N6)-threonylcarbamoyltransferase complex ATPase subunit type 1 TsaE [Bdellovibrio sp.]
MENLLNSERTVRNLIELEQFWKEFLPQLKNRAILLLSGDVGTGKTTSVQMMAKSLGMSNVQSPSFAIHLRYENAQGKSLDHLDLYRLKDDDDLESSGFWDLFAAPEGLVVIEWAQRLDFDYLPLNWQRVEVRFTKLSETERKISSRVL